MSDWTQKKGKKQGYRLNLPSHEIKRRYLAGETTPQLARAYGCSVLSILNRLKDLGVELRARGTQYAITDDMVRKAKELRDMGLSAHKVARELNVPVQAVRARVSFKRKKIVLDMEEIRMDYEAGESITELARRHGVCTNTMANRMHAHGIAVRNTGPIPGAKDYDDSIAAPLRDLLETLQKFRETEGGRKQAHRLDPQIIALQKVVGVSCTGMV